MSEQVLLTEEEFLASLEAEEGRPPSAIPVFMPPKPTDRGYVHRREKALDYQRRAMAVQTAVGQMQTQFAPVQARLNEIVALQTQLGEEKAQLEATGAATVAIDDALVKLEGEATALAGQTFALLEEINKLSASQVEFLNEQVEFLLPYIRAIKYPSSADGATSARYWARPYGGEDLERFEAEARALLRDSTQNQFNNMLAAVTGQGGQQAVPPKSAGR